MAPATGFRDTLFLKFRATGSLGNSTDDGPWYLRPSFLDLSTFFANWRERTCERKWGKGFEDLRFSLLENGSVASKIRNATV